MKDCPKTLLASFGAVTNLNTHLQRHASLNEWYKIYLKQKDSIKRSFITEPQLNFVKLWISSKSTLELINNNFPRLCLKDEIKLPCTKTFRWTWLEEVFDKLHDLIEAKLERASYVTIIPDCWSDTPNTHYLGI